MIETDQLVRATGLAVDFGGTKVAAARLERGEIIKQVRTATNAGGDTQQQINVISDLLGQLDISEDDRIGIAITGRVTATGDWHPLNLDTLPNIGSVPLRSILSHRFAREVSVQNDATAAIIGEYVAGAGRGHGSVGYITVSTGIGGGFVLNGVPLVSHSGLASHVGFTTSRIASDRCGSGRLQTVESIASGKAIARRAAESGHGKLDAKAVFQAHLSGQKWASDLISQSANAVAELCANLTAILDPDLILIGGSIGLAPGYLAMVEGFLESEPEAFRVPLKPAILGERATFIGALCT